MTCKTLLPFLNHLIQTIMATLVLSLCCASLAVAQTPNSAPTDLGGPCILAGDVVSQRTGHDTYGADVTGADVTLISDGTIQAQVQTNAVGEFAFNVPVGSYVLTFRAHGFAPKQAAVKLKPEPPANIVCGSHVAVELLPLGKIAPPLPSILTVYSAAISQYCKKHPGSPGSASMACVYYTTHANSCLGEALRSEPTYSTILVREHQGLSLAQAVQQMGDTDVAELAATVIDGLNRKSKNGADDPTAPEAFARVVILPTCLKNIAQ